MKTESMEVLRYCNNIWIRSTKLYELHKLPYLMVNDKAFYEAKSYFKERYNIEVHDSGLESTDDHGVILAVYITQNIDITTLKKIPDLFRIGMIQSYNDDCGGINGYLKLYISINQQMENV